MDQLVRSSRRWITPFDWDEDDLRGRIQLGGCGDDPAEIREIFETSDTNYSWDFCD